MTDLIALELNRAFAMSAEWDEAAAALKRAMDGDDSGFDQCDAALARFKSLQSKGRECELNKPLPSNS